MGTIGKALSDVAASATDMASSVEETSATTEELVRSIRSVAEHAKQLEGVAQAAASNAPR